MAKHRFILALLSLLFSATLSAQDSTIFYTAGSLPLGFTLGYFLVSGEVFWPTLAAGVGLTGIAIPLHIRQLKQTQRAVDEYNHLTGVRSCNQRTMKIAMGVQQFGLGIRVQL